MRLSRHFIFALLSALLLACLAAPADARNRNTRSSQRQPSSYCTVSQRCSYFTYDATSGTVLEQLEPDKKIHPASLTKLMTAYLLFEALEKRQISLTDRIRVSSHASDMPALKLGLRPGDTIQVEDALEAVTVRSANDAAVMIAEAISGSEEAFARRMTLKAHEIGMNRTTFRNASGLPDDAQVTSARDMATLAYRVLTDYPKYRRYFGMTEANVSGRTIEGHNRLLNSGVVQGGKTGYIRDSGYNLVAWTEREGRLVIGSIFGGNSASARDAKLTALLDSSYRKLGGLALPAVGQSPYSQAPLPRAKPGSVSDLIENASPGLSEAVAVTNASAAPTAAEPAIPDNVKETDFGQLTVASSTFSTSWAIQVGAYKDVAQAQQALQAATRRAPELLATAYPRALVTNTTLGDLYRAQLIGLDERAARSACDVLTKQGMQCLTMPPGNQPS